MHINTSLFSLILPHTWGKLSLSLSFFCSPRTLFFPLFLGALSWYSFGSSVTESGQLWPSVGASELHLFTWVLKLRVWQWEEKRRGGDKGSILEQEGRGMDRWVQREYLLGWQLSEALESRGLLTGARTNCKVECFKKQHQKKKYGTQSDAYR